MSLFFEENLGLVYYVTESKILWITDQDLITGAVRAFQSADRIIFSYDYRADKEYLTKDLINSGKLGDIYNAKSAYENVVNYSFNNMDYTFCKVMPHGDAIISNCGNIFMVTDLVNSYYAINIAANSINIVNKWFYKSKEEPTKIARLECEADINEFMKQNENYSINMWRHYPVKFNGQFYRIEFTKTGGGCGLYMAGQI
jgi:hypothetical protein